MKKLVFLSLILGMSVVCHAELQLTSGSLDALKKSGEYAYVDIDWSKAKVVEFDGKNRVDKTWGTVDAYNKAQGADWVSDWPGIKREILHNTAWEKYPTRPCFNRKNKKGVLITVNPQTWKAYQNTKDEEQREKLKKNCIWVNPSTAKYKFVLTVNQVDMGNSVAAAFGWSKSTGGAIIKGTIRLVEIKTGKTLATIAVNYCKGIGNYSQRARLNDVIVGEILGRVPELL